MPLSVNDLVELLDLSEALICVVGSEGEVLFQNAPLRDAVVDSAPLGTLGITEIDGSHYRVVHRPLPGRPDATIRIAHPCRPPAIPDEDLEARSQILNALVVAAPAAILVLDLEMRVTMWNPACHRLFGWRADEVIGKPYPLVPADEWERFEGFFATVIRGEGFAGVEAERTDRHGKRLHIAISTAPIKDSAGQVTGAMAILEDITERKALEARYQQATRLEAIGRLAGGVAHDFNNVLTVILAYADMLILDTSNGLTHASATAIKRAAERAAELTRQLLAFSRRQVLQARVMDVNEVVLESIDMLRRLIGADIRVSTSLQPFPAWVHADPSQIERLLMNLAANARDAMPDGGQLTLSTRTLTHASRPNLTSGVWIELAVSDTGEGMDPETAERIFEPFFTTKPMGEGTGLGLASVYGIVKQSGGEVDVVSSPGNGATFRITLPMTEQRAHPDTDSAEETPAGGTATILLAEDDPDVRRVLRTILRSRGYRVLEAESGEAALELSAATEDTIHLLLTDVVMPGMGGSELVARLATLRPEIEVLYVSGYTDSEVVRRGVERGAHFIQKPFTAATLLDTVSRILDS